MSEQEALTFETRDEFNRVGIATNLIKLLTSPIDISPMVIDGDWGTGKTEFGQKLIHKFKAAHQNYQLVYVDAFQADHANDPLMTILAEVAALIPEGEKKEGFFQKAIPVARYGLQTAGKALVGHVLKENADDIADGLEKHLQDAANKAIDASVMAVLKDHEKAKQNLKALQSTLAELAKDAPIVIFIDELDRCRPDFAVQMLEVIKHTFDVENVKFVLVTNTKQLRAAINHSYGQHVDAQRYLDKFLKFSARLPNVVPGRSGFGEDRLPVSVAHFANLVSGSEVLRQTDLGGASWAPFRFVLKLIKVNQLSLREVETLARQLEIYQVISEHLDAGTTFGHVAISILGVFLSCFRPDLYDEIQSDRVDAEAIAALFGVSALPDYDAKQLQRDIPLLFCVSLAQKSQVNFEKFRAREREIQECWRIDFERCFDGFGAPVNIWQSFRDVFSVLGLVQSQ